MDFIKKLFERKLTAKEKYQRRKIEMRFKNSFRWFFEGVADEDGFNIQDPIVDIPISNLGITNFKFKYKKEGAVIVTVVLSRPGLIIGKYGSTIDTLNETIKENDGFPIEIKIEESTVWK